MIYPSVILVVIVCLFIILPFSEIFTPDNLGNIWSNEKDIPNHNYVHTTVEELHYSGYNVSHFGKGEFGYYYTLKDNKCIFVLIPVSDTPEETLKDYDLYGKVINSDDSNSFDNLLESLASDLNWSTSGLKSVTYDFIISNADYHPIMYICLFLLLLIGVGIALYFIAANIFLMRRNRMVSRHDKH